MSIFLSRSNSEPPLPLQPPLSEDLRKAWNIFVKREREFQEKNVNVTHQIAYGHPNLITRRRARLVLEFSVFCRLILRCKKEMSGCLELRVFKFKPFKEFFDNFYCHLFLNYVLNFVYKRERFESSVSFRFATQRNWSLISVFKG